MLRKGHMQNLSRKPRCLGFVALIVGWFGVFYLYVLVRVRPELFYQQNPVVFLFDAAFFTAFWSRPGGLVQYASAFLSPLFACGWLGALVVTLLAAFICLATRQYLAALAGTGGRTVFLVPAILILVTMGRYNHPVGLCAGLCVVLGLASAYVLIGQRHPAVRLAAFVVASAVGYYVAGGLYVVFAVLCGIFEWTSCRQRWLGACYALSAAAIPTAAGVWLWGLGFPEAYQGLLLPPARYWLAMPSSALLSQSILAALLLSFPVAAVAAAWRRHPAGSPALPAETPASVEPTDGAADVPRSLSARRLAVQSAALLVVAVGADFLVFDSPTKYALAVAYSAEREQWADVLKQAPRLRPGDAWNVFQVNRALYHRGELLERMFSYPQGADAARTLALQFASLTETAQRVPSECSDLFFDLGRINESQHMAYEALELFGERPHTLQRLVYLHTIKGEPDAARRFLAVLERSLGHRGWARDVLQQLDADPTLSGEPLAASRRVLMVARDFTGRLDLETMLGQLLERNPQNRMAFEYLMAYYLLNRRIDKLVTNLSRFDAFGEARWPRHCEEAIVIYQEMTGKQVSGLEGRPISPETWRRNSEFVQALGRFQGNADAAFRALHHDFGDSYFFFCVFGHNDLQSALARPSR
jgi:hypothetical protein